MADETEAGDRADRVTARDAAADAAPVQASDPRSATIDRAGFEPASPGASADEAAAKRGDR